MVAGGSDDVQPGGAGDLGELAGLPPEPDRGEFDDSLDAGPGDRRQFGGGLAGVEELITGVDRVRRKMCSWASTLPS
jgi:hypothetical protein